MITLLAICALVPQDLTVREWKKFKLSEQFTCEGAAAGDFNKDGKGDVAIGPWWYEGPDFSKKHEYYPVKVWKTDNEYSNNFMTFTYDFNKDGWTDILVYGFPGKEATWYENPQGKEGHWKATVVYHNVDNESPMFEDVNGDKVPDVVCSSGGFLGYATIADGKFHPISPKGGWQRFTHGIGVGDVNGDGRTDFLDKDGWWEQPAKLEGDPVWTPHKVKFGGGGAQMHVYDVDGDGQNDVITSLAAHGYGLSWFKATQEGEEIKFSQQLIMGAKEDENRYGLKFSQLHAVELVDIDGDGLKDIITGKRHFAHGSKGDAEPLADPVLYWFKLVRGKDGVDWKPFRIDSESGVGTQISVVDVDGDKLPDVVVGSKKGAYVHLQSVKKVSQSEFDAAQPKPLK
jgi:FG-GAP-like repeat